MGTASLHELELDPDDSAELLELVEGEASCALVYDAVGRLYDELASGSGRECRWRLAEEERQDLLPELEECADTIELPVLDRLVARLQALPDGDATP